MNNVNLFHTLSAPFLHIFLSNLFIAFKAAFKPILLTYPGKLFLANGIPRSITTFLPNLLNQKLHLVELF